MCGFRPIGRMRTTAYSSRFLVRPVGKVDLAGAHGLE